MAMIKRKPAIIVEYVSDTDRTGTADAHLAILNLARALARMAAREDDAKENGV
jgi:hypothetical protein